MLIEGFTSEKMKLVVTFVCRIMRECKQSIIFKVQNPWVRANLEILKEISEQCGQPTPANPRTEVIMEIESLFKHFGLNIAEQQHQGFLMALQTQKYTSLSQQVELRHLTTKPRIVPLYQQGPQSAAPSQPAQD